MAENTKTYSCVKNHGGVPSLFINGKPFPCAAYMTYLEKFNRYSDFADAGYKLFSVPVLFSGRWISNSEFLTPFKRGIFDVKGSPDYSLFDEAIEKILAACPDAYVIPRVNISMPLWWEKENPGHVNIYGGKVLRESFYSEKWRQDAETLLRKFISYVENSLYADRIAGYHLAGGNTEEWFHFDMNAGCCENAESGFRRYLGEYHPGIRFSGLPDMSLLKSGNTLLNNEYLSAFLEYASFAVADAIDTLASAVKDESKNRVAVGVFYGYSLEVSSPLHGIHALNKLLKSKSVDFICSPNSYIGTRDHALDWTEMYPADSVRLHGKMCFQECDIRTHLTVPLGEKDKETDPQNTLSGEIWQGVSTLFEAKNNVKKSFARQLVKGNGFWWFDMWGGWFACPELMEDMKQFRKIYEKSLETDKSSLAEYAVFVDESAFGYMSDCAPRYAMYHERHELGLTGAPYDTYDVFDFPTVYGKYKAVIFMTLPVTERMKNALEICERENVPHLVISEEKFSFSLAELCDFLKANNIKTYCESGDILYINKNFAAIHALKSGRKEIFPGGTFSVTELLCESRSTFVGNKITTDMQAGETKIFMLEKAK